MSVIWSALMTSDVNNNEREKHQEFQNKKNASEKLSGNRKGSAMPSIRILKDFLAMTYLQELKIDDDSGQCALECLHLE